MSTVRNLSKESLRVISANKGLQIRDGLESEYPDIYTDEVIDALKALSVFNKDQKMLMEKRYATRAQRFRNKERIRFLDRRGWREGFWWREAALEYCARLVAGSELIGF